MFHYIVRVNKTAYVSYLSGWVKKVIGGTVSERSSKKKMRILDDKGG